MANIVFLAFTVVMFIVVFGVLFQLTPTILGTFFNVLDDLQPNLSAEWQAVYTDVNDQAQFLVPLTMSLGIVIVVVKVLMIASARGRD